MTFILFMVLQPEVAKKAQAEIDAFVGRDRLPDFEDRDALPYIDCILKEILRYVIIFRALPPSCEILLNRWNPPVPLGWSIYILRKFLPA